MDTALQWLRRIEAKLDEWGRPAWIAAFVLGFILVWPLGLAILLYAIWSGRMSCGKKRRHGWGRSGPASTGNVAFDEYRDATLRRLEEEQGAFTAFMDNLRRAKDKAEFDQFMSNRGRAKSDDSGDMTQPA